MGRRKDSQKRERVELQAGQVTFCRFEFSKGVTPTEIAKRLSRGADEDGLTPFLDAVIAILEASQNQKPYKGFAEVSEPNVQFIRSRLERHWSISRIATLYGFSPDDADFLRFVRGASPLAQPSQPIAYPVRTQRKPDPVGDPRHNNGEGTPASLFQNRGRNRFGCLLDSTGTSEIWQTMLADEEITELAMRFFGTPETCQKQRRKVVHTLAGLRQGRTPVSISRFITSHNGGTEASVMALIYFLTQHPS